jgi:hypothetical protein
MSETTEPALPRLFVGVAPSPLFADPGWRALFHRLLSDLIDISEDLRRNVKLPGFLNLLEWEVNRLKISYEHLGRHLLEAREYEGGYEPVAPGLSARTCSWHDPPGKNMHLAYQWMWSLFVFRPDKPHSWEMDADTLRRLEWLPSDSLMDTLRRIRDLIPVDEPEVAPASPSGDPSPSGTAAPSDPPEGELTRLPAERTEAAGPKAPPRPDGADAVAKTAGRRRGRRKGQDKIGEALTRLTARMKDGLPVDIPSIAKDVRCTPENLRQSSRFMDAYEALTRAFARLPRGRKEDGIVEVEDEGNIW